jgi:hypothetical protein
VLLMYLWAALFSGLVVGLSVLRITLVWFAVITLAAIAALLLATAPKLRPWRSGSSGKRARPRESRIRSADPLSATPDLAAQIETGPIGTGLIGTAPIGEAAPGVRPPAADLAAPAGRPAPGVLPPPVLPAGDGLPSWPSRS